MYFHVLRNVLRTFCHWVGFYSNFVVLNNSSIVTEIFFVTKKLSILLSYCSTDWAQRLLIGPDVFRLTTFTSTTTLSFRYRLLDNENPYHENAQRNTGKRLLVFFSEYVETLLSWPVQMTGISQDMEYTCTIAMCKW